MLMLFVYSSLISGLCAKGSVDRGIKLLGEMTGKGILPTVVTYTCLVHGLIKMGRWEEVQKLLNDM